MFFGRTPWRTFSYFFYIIFLLAVSVFPLSTFDIFILLVLSIPSATAFHHQLLQKISHFNLNPATISFHH
jgi:hypothetical protein